VSLVLFDTYQRITGDTTTGASQVADALAEAQALLEEELGRELESKSRTERLYPDPTGRVYPMVTPVTVAPSGLLVDGSSMYSAGPFQSVPGFIFEGNWADLTYTGGYVERSANPAATNRLPAHVERDLCWCAFRALAVVEAQSLALTPAGASRMQVGDIMVMFGKGGQAGEVRVGSDGVTDPVWSRQTLRLCRRGRRI
jgi:hypothetical protein